MNQNNEYNAERLGLLYTIIQVTQKAKLTKQDIQNYLNLVGNKPLGELNINELKLITEKMLSDIKG
jgi:hypothetical protein